MTPERLKALDEWLDQETGGKVPAQHRDTMRACIAALAECYRLSGADPDGNEDWRLAVHAVEEVREMRKNYDELEGMAAGAGAPNE